MARPDEIGFKAAVDKVTINDLHATILHLLGLHHEKLTFRYSGRDFRLTDVAGEVVKAVVRECGASVGLRTEDSLRRAQSRSEIAAKAMRQPQRDGGLVPRSSLMTFPAAIAHVEHN